jgi:hypothetical protein
VHPGLQDQDIDRIIDSVREALTGA